MSEEVNIKQRAVTKNTKIVLTEDSISDSDPAGCSSGCGILAKHSVWLLAQQCTQEIITVVFGYSFTDSGDYSAKDIFRDRIPVVFLSSITKRVFSRSTNWRDFKKKFYGLPPGKLTLLTVEQQ